MQASAQNPADLFSQVNFAAPGAVAQTAAHHAQAGAPASVVIDISKVIIEPTNSQTSFKVTGTAGNEPLKQALSELGGAYNSRVKGYIFQADRLQDVCRRLGMNTAINLVDSRKTITVDFTQSFQWNGDLEQAAELLKRLGLRKKQGSGNSWQGDLSQANNFLHAFQMGAVQPPAQGQGQ